MKNTVRRILACMLVVFMAVTACGSVFALGQETKKETGLKALTSDDFDRSQVRAVKTDLDLSAKRLPADAEEVTIMVELKDAPAMKKHNSYTRDAQNYAAKLRQKQETEIKRIKNSLGVDFEVTDRYVLLFNGFAFTGKAGLVDELNKIDGVHAFVAPEWEVPTPTLFNSTDMITAPEAWDLDYTGKGRTVAILDTGCYVEHEAFENDPDAETARFDKDAIAELISEGNLYDADKMNADNVYYSGKIPYRWNYDTHTYNVAHTSSDHGTHVAGIAAGNGGEIKGVAPDAQILVLQVFHGGSASWNTIIHGMEDCVVLGADAANLSLGSACGFTHYYDDSYGTVFENLVNAGVNISMSAGNDYSTAQSSYFGYALADNPEYGVVGSPSTWPEALSIASINNTKVSGMPLTHVETGLTFPYNENNDYGNANLVETFGGQTLEYVCIPGYGEEADFEGIDVEGKIAVMMRGSISFYVKVDNAAAHGAVAAVIYNNTTGTIGMNLTGLTSGIPAVSILQAYGQELAQAGTGTLEIGTEKVLMDDPDGGTPSDFSSWGPTSDLRMKPQITGPGGNIYSSVDPALENGELYQAWSGTSMSAPHVTGGMALVSAFVDDAFLELALGDADGDGELTMDDVLRVMRYAMHLEELDDPESCDVNGDGKVNMSDALLIARYVQEISFDFEPYVETLDTAEKQQMVDTLLMSTANPFNDAGGNYASVRKQGAGLMNIGAAITTKAYITVENDIRPQLELGDDPDWTGEFEMTFTVNNFGDEELTYTVQPTVLTDDIAAIDIVNNSAYLYAFAQKSWDITEYCEIDAPETVTVPAKGAADVTVSIAIDPELVEEMAGICTSGFFAEGFIELLSDTEPTLNVPFLGFVGDWNKDVPVFDQGFYYEDEWESYVNGTSRWGNHPDHENFIGFTYDGEEMGLGLNHYVETEDKSYYLEDRNAISPNGDGFADTADTYHMNLLRNCAEAGIELVDAEGNSLKTLAYDTDVRKCFYYANGEVYYNMSDYIGLTNWDASSYAGQDLFIRIYGIVDNDGAVTTEAFTEDTENVFNEWLIPVYVDVEVPTAEFVSYVDGVLTVKVTDNHYAAYAGVWEGEIDEEGELTLEGNVAKQGIFEEERGAETEVEFEGVEAGMLVCLSDYAGNESVYVFDGEGLEETDVESWSHGPAVIPNLDIYGYASNVSADNQQTHAWVGFNTVDRSMWSVMAMYDPFVYQSGTLCGTTIYAITEDSELVAIDATADDWTPSEDNIVGTVTGGSGAYYEMAYDANNDIIYVCDGFSDIYSLDPETCELTKVCETAYGAVAMDVIVLDGDSYLLLIDAEGYLALLDPNSGENYDQFDTGYDPVNMSTGSAYQQCGAIMGDYFVWEYLPYDISAYTDIKLLAINLNDFSVSDMGNPYVINGPSNLNMYLFCMFGLENEGGGDDEDSEFDRDFFDESIGVNPDYNPPAASLDVENAVFYDNFEDGTADWMKVDADGDGHNWWGRNFYNSVYQDGPMVAYSESYRNGVGAFRPDNWMVSPEITVGEDNWLGYFIAAMDPSWCNEHYGVYVLTAGQDVEDATLLKEETLTTADCTENLIDLSDYAGQTVRIAFRHFNCTDMYMIAIDSVCVAPKK